MKERERLPMPAVAFLHGRPGPHPFHRRLADAVCAESFFVDFHLRWHDQKASRVKRYASSLICALTFDTPGRYQIFMTEGLHLVPLLMRIAGRLTPAQRIVSLLDSEQLYFISAHRYSSLTERLLLAALKRQDALICIGEMQTALARALLRDRLPTPQTMMVPSAVPSERLARLLAATPSFADDRIVCVANGPSGWRGWYKGIDLLFEVIGRVLKTRPRVRLTLVGSWDERYLLAQCGQGNLPSWLDYTGSQADILPALCGASLCVHLGRGEAFGISVLEALACGVPAIVSEWTGAREAVTRLDPTFVVPLHAGQVAARIVTYLASPRDNKQRLSARAKDIAREYREDVAVAVFREAVRKLASASLGVSASEHKAS